MATKDNLKEKIQVLLTLEDLHELNVIIMNKALKAKKRPEPISLYVRSLIKDHILANQPQQRSYAKEAVDKIKKS
jgi:hypothetical protein